jgi:hypothetical protein
MAKLSGATSARGAGEDKVVANGQEKQPWAPIVALDVPNASTQAIQEAIGKFWAEKKRREQDGTLPPFPFDHDGWYAVTPQMAEAAMLNSHGNREIRVPNLRAIVADMQAGTWAGTGQALCSIGNNLQEGFHRLMACLLSGTGFETFVVVTARPRENLFAYYDRGLKRQGHDALHIMGLNGAGKILAKAVEHLAVRYDHGALGVQKQGRHRPITPIETVSYLQDHPDFVKAAQHMLGSYPEAVDVIRSKAAAVFFAWKVLEAYDEAVLDAFCIPLGSGANLTEDDVLLALRAKLLQGDVPGNKMADRTRLAYVMKAFLMHVNGQKMPRTRGGKITPLNIGLDEEFPRIEGPLAEAAQ